MAPSTKTAQVQIMSNCDVFHELWKANPHEVPNLTPTTIQNCQILEGEVGTEGCIYTSFLPFHINTLEINAFDDIYVIADGKDCVFKSLTQEINERKKSVTYKGLEGDLLELYKTFVVHIHVDTDGSNNLVTWTVEYEKMNPNDPDPDTLMELYKKMTKDIETCHLEN
ncbi:hypothetical protein LXL04_022373 [Taraxacum kok-saghyz]